MKLAIISRSKLAEFDWLNTCWNEYANVIPPNRQFVPRKHSTQINTDIITFVTSPLTTWIWLLQKNIGRIVTNFCLFFFRMKDKCFIHYVSLCLLVFLKSVGDMSDLSLRTYAVGFLHISANTWRTTERALR